MHIANIAQQVRKEDPVHRVRCVGWMRPDEDHSVFRAIRDRPEGVWLPGRDLVRGVGGRPDGVVEGVGGCSADAAGEDLQGFGLRHVEVKRWSLEESLAGQFALSKDGSWDEIQKYLFGGRV